MVTLDTVRKHVSHVLGKLGAANHTEAVSRARERSLISWRGATLPGRSQLDGAHAPGSFGKDP